MTDYCLSIRSLASIALVTALAGCGGGMRMEPGFVPPPSVAVPVSAPAPANGAIYQTASGYAGLHEGQRARHVGDIVTIMLMENIDTSKSTSGRTGRDGDTSVTAPNTGPFSFIKPGVLNFSAQGSFKGQGDASQSSTLNGAIAVTIAEVRPNGTAIVVGEKQMALSQGHEWVQFAGTLRLADISTDNTVISSQIADARIIYSGKGAIQQASNPGWLSRFFNMLSPF